MIKAGATRWHRPLGWVGGVALLIAAFSGLTHPLMTWFGPQQAAFFPPQAVFSAADIAAIPGVLAEHQIERAQLVKAIPTAEGNLLQVTVDNGIDRRYFSLADGREYPLFDLQQAKWLARYYTGQDNTAIRSIQLQTAFDNAYPAVNRLLPVWRVAFDTDDNLIAFIHTELNALASLTNNTRTLQQTVFRTLHSWSWLERWEPLRVGVMLVLCLALLALCLSGMVMVFTLPRRRLRHGARRWHRTVAFFIWLPLLAFTGSGLYHLLHNAGSHDFDGFAYDRPLTLSGLHAEPLSVGEEAAGGATVADAAPSLAQSDPAAHHHQLAAGEAKPPRPLNSVTLLTGTAGEIVYRLAQPAGRPGQVVEHHARFDGTPTETPAQFIGAATGQPLHLQDRDLARLAAARHLAVAADELGEASRVTQFGSDYDFRNKRLPVWRVSYGHENVFIDPANGALVDRVTVADGVEGAVFGNLHKWNFLTPWSGREIRDSLMVAVMVIALGFTGLGFTLQLRQRRRRRSTAAV